MSRTCLARLLGPRVLLARRGSTPLVSADVARALLEGVGVISEANAPIQALLGVSFPFVHPVDVWRRLAGHAAAEWRARGAFGLGLTGDPRAVPWLLDHLGDADAGVRCAATEALGRLGAVDAVARFSSADGDVRVEAARLEAVERMGAWNLWLGQTVALHGDVGELARVLRVAQERGRSGGVAAFLGHSDPDLQRVAARMLAGRAGWVAGALGPLLRRLEEPEDDETTVLCAIACGRAGDEAAERLVHALDADDEAVRAVAAIALGTDPYLTASTAEALRARLEDDAPVVRQEAALALRVAGVPDPRAEEIGLTSLELRYRILERAAAAGDAPAAMLWGRSAPGPMLWPWVLSPGVEESVRAQAAWGLAVADRRVEPVLERLATNASGDTSLDLRCACAAALAFTGRAPNLPFGLARVLSAEVTPLRSAEVSAEEQVSSLLVVAMQDVEPSLRMRALRELGRYPRAVRAPYRTFVDAIAAQDANAGVRAEAAAVDGNRGSASAAEADLARALVPRVGGADDEPPVAVARRIAAAESGFARALAWVWIHSDDTDLASFGASVLAAAAREAEVHAYVGWGCAALEDPSWRVREWACALLGALPADLLSDADLDEVEEMLRARAEDDPDRDVRGAASVALDRLGRAGANDA